MKDNAIVEILLVEDSEFDAELTLEQLKESNISNMIFWVKDGEEALDFLFARGEYIKREVENRPKLILLDLKMPKVDGLQVLEEIRKDRRTKSIPVVMLTSSQEEQDMVRSYELGVNSYIVKPVDSRKFCKAIEELGLYWILLNKPIGTRNHE